MKFFPYQKESILEIEDFGGRALLALEMGLGKSIITLAYLRKNRKHALPALIVCPASVKYNWEHECVHNFGIRPRVLEGQKPPRNIKRLLDLEKITIINYDILKYWVPYLEKLGYRTIVFDECQYLANRSAQRTKAAAKLARGIPYALALSGTPLTNRPAELFSTLNILCPDEYTSFWKFARSYCRPRLTRWGWDYSGASNLKDLHRRLLRTCLIRYLKKDVLHELPDKVRRVIPLEMDNPDEYFKARDNFLGWLKEKHPDRISRALKATALAKTGDLLRLAARQKLRGVVDWCNRFLEETDEKLIIFAVHRKCIDVLERKINAPSVTVDGSVIGRQRQTVIEEFRKNPNIRVFIGNIRAAGVGINLTQSSTVVFAELWWKPGDHTQAEDRSHRIKQDQPVFIYYFVAAETIEETLCKIIQKKQEVIHATLDGHGKVNDMNVYDELLNMLSSKDDSRD